jgi:hypothetical protein
MVFLFLGLIYLKKIGHFFKVIVVEASECLFT